MGKESRLKGGYKAGETRQQYANGDRKAYDREACPNGFDEHVWSLALYFEQKLQELGLGHPGRPILYTELYEKILSDRDLTSLLDAGTLATNKGEGGKALVTSATIRTKEDVVNNINNKLLFIEIIIDRYYSTLYSDTAPTINDFINNFKQLKGEVIAEEYLKYLKDHSTRVSVVQREPLPDKRPKNLVETLDITNHRVYTEKQMEETWSTWEGNQ